jgi:1-acyl-sn-glycerol-3-phosphate acyltransferase
MMCSNLIVTREIQPDYSEAPDPELYRKSVERTHKVFNKRFGFHAFGQENVPTSGAGAVAFVHRSLVDPWAVGLALPRATRGMAKKELQRFYYFGLGNKYLASRGLYFIDRKNMGHSSFQTGLDIARLGLLQAIAPEGTHKNSGNQLGETMFGLGRLAASAASEGIPFSIIPLAMTTEHIRLKTLHQKKPIVSVVGQPLMPELPVDTIKQRRLAAEEIDRLVRIALQHTFDDALERQQTLLQS